VARQRKTHRLRGLCRGFVRLDLLKSRSGASAARQENVMNIRNFPLVAGLALATLCGAPLAHGDTLLMQRVHQERGANVPNRGMSMAQVESRFGAPTDKMSPAGGEAPTHPVINRWVYPNFIVYFERDHVIDSVLNQATSTEEGPKGSTSRR
jgi:hypothetical protein